MYSNRLYLPPSYTTNRTSSPRTQDLAWFCYTSSSLHPLARAMVPLRSPAPSLPPSLSLELCAVRARRGGTGVFGVPWGHGPGACEYA